MSSMPERLAVIDSCDGCGDCCKVVSRPPFYRVFDESGEDAWERLRADRPDVVAELHADYAERDGQPAVRFTAHPVSGSTRNSRKCRHYEYRPRACREFEMGGTDCRDARRRAGFVS